MADFEEMGKRMADTQGYIAALDQSGGSTPKALREYGVSEKEYTPETMMDVVHQMRTRIMTSKAFKGDRTLAAILFEDTMDREVEGMPTPKYLWEVKKIVPLLKCDKGLAEEENNAQQMKPIPGLDELLKRARGLGVYGTKMRSVIKMANAKGIKGVVDQQFEVGKQIIAAGLVPIIEPEVDINSPEKAKAEDLLKADILANLDKLAPNQKVMLKLSLPTKDNLYMECIEHPNCVRVVALSGGHPRVKANEILSRNKKMIASFSRALTEGLSAQMTDEAFDAELDEAIQGIYEASV